MQGLEELVEGNSQWRPVDMDCRRPLRLARATYHITTFWLPVARFASALIAFSREGFYKRLTTYSPIYLSRRHHSSDTLLPAHHDGTCPIRLRGRPTLAPVGRSGNDGSRTLHPRPTPREVQAHATGRGCN